MKKSINLVTVFCYLILGRLVSAKLAVKIQKTEPKPDTILRYMPNYLDGGHPQPLPTTAPKQAVISSYTTLYQGVKNEDDKRVFRKKFDYPAIMEGQKVVCEGLFDCVISHIAIESTEAIPVLLRGGAGYRHFTAIIKSRPQRALKGQVRAFCRKKDVLEDNKSNGRRFDFGDRLADRQWDGRLAYLGK